MRGAAGIRMGVTRIWLVRHGEPEARGLCYGSLDVPLSEHGREQIRLTAGHLKDETLSAIYTSPLSRARESADLIAGASIQVVAAFSEMNFGAFEGLSFAEIEERYPEIYRHWMAAPTEVKFPDGESFSEMKSRVLAAFDEIRARHDGETIAIVSHAGVNRIVIAWALGIADAHVFRIGQDYACLNQITIIDGFPILNLLNQSKA